MRYIGISDHTNNKDEDSECGNIVCGAILIGAFITILAVTTSGSGHSHPDSNPTEETASTSLNITSSLFENITTTLSNSASAIATTVVENITTTADPEAAHANEQAYGEGAEEGVNTGVIVTGAAALTFGVGVGLYSLYRYMKPSNTADANNTRTGNVLSPV